MSWSDDFMPLAHWALQTEDLRYRFMAAGNPSEIDTSAGIAWAYETSLVHAIFQAALYKGYRWTETVDYEAVYPTEKPGNGPRADLAFKDNGRGTNWAYIEVKGWSAPAPIAADINKLRTISDRVQRWIFTYKVRPKGGKAKSLRALLGKNFKNDLRIHGVREFPTLTKGGKPGVCELALARVS